MDIPVQGYLAKLRLLEESVGAATTYKILDPFHWRVGGDIIAVQYAASTIASFLGLEGLTFIVGIVQQQKDTAAHIQLERGQSEVFVELSPGVLGHDSAVLATLAHELSHKFLHVHGITCGSNPYEHEVLTDITAVYVGLGKLMLNGCKSETVTYTVDGKSSDTFSVGYIDRHHLAFVYRAVCAMRKIPQSSWAAGLTGESLAAIRLVETSYGQSFDESLSGADGRGASADALRKKVTSQQEMLTSSDRQVRLSREHYLTSIAAELNATHQELSRALHLISELRRQNGVNPHVWFLDAVQRLDAVSSLTARVSEKRAFTRPFTKALEHICSDLEKVAEPVKADNVQEIITCPVDGARLRVPVGRPNLEVTCPSCRYRFLTDTRRRAVFREESRNGLSAIKSWFRRK
ncbi:MAG: hypothetical protein LAN70_04495 [Acidobacteriia bacterium]|nr:hypothetical protein [Terriglobia bacterium]